MTFARFKATGSGTLAARVSIEGVGIEFVSDPAMVRTTADGRRRVLALPPMGEGVVIEESVNIPEATLDAQGLSIRLIETEDEDVAQAFAWRPDVERFIEATIPVDPSDPDYNTVQLTGGTTGIAVGDVVHVGTEAMLVTAVNADTNTLTVTRAYWDTIAQKHWSNTGSIRRRMLSNRPYRIRGRRARVYLYGDGDDLAGDGTQVWLGTVTSDPECTEAGTVWLLQLASISKRLDGKLGGGLDVPLRPRGIYYSWAAPLCVHVREIDTVGNPTTVGGEFTGFFETQREFIDSFNTWLDTNVNAFTASTVRAIETGDGRWTIETETGASLQALVVRLVSWQDGLHDAVFDPGIFGGSTFYDSDGNVITSLTPGTLIFGRWSGLRTDGFAEAGDARRVPRGYFGVSHLEDVEPFFRTDPTVRTTWPASRLYLSNALPADATSVRIEWPSGFTYEYPIMASDAAANYVDLRNAAFRSETGRIHSERWGAYSLPVISLTREIARGHLAALRNAIVADGPEYCNRGASPFLTDTDLADWTAVVNAAAVLPWQRSRVWTLVTAVDLLDVLSAEMRLLGIYPVIESDGRIGVRAIDVPNATIADATVLDDELISVDWSTMVRGGQTINRVLLRAGYDPLEDDWTNTHEVTDETSYAQDHEYRDLEIEPRSRAAAGDAIITANDLANAAAPVLNLFGYPYDIVRIHLPWVYFDVTLGDVVSFSADHLPDLRTGRRPIKNVVGIVIGRRWELGKPHGTLSVLIPWQNVAGYTPNARILVARLVLGEGGGRKWELTVDATKHAPDGHSIDEFFRAGDAIRIVQYDSENPTVVTGTVESVNTVTHVITVMLDVAWTPGSATWELLFDNYANATEDQRRYCFIADSETLLGTEGARLFGA